MSNSSLQSKNNLIRKNSESKPIAKKKKLESINPKLLDSVVNTTENLDNSFENLCKQTCINDEKSLQAYHDIAVTGKNI